MSIIDALSISIFLFTITIAAMNFFGWDIQVKFEPRDLWVGLYWNCSDRSNDIFICLVPLFVIHCRQPKTEHGVFHSPVVITDSQDLHLLLSEARARYYFLEKTITDIDERDSIAYSCIKIDKYINQLFKEN